MKDAVTDPNTVAKRLAAEPDVKQVIEFIPTDDPTRFRYLIETPFESFPRFVIGTTDAELEDVRLEIRCGERWNANRHWSLALARAGKFDVSPFAITQ